MKSIEENQTREIKLGSFQTPGSSVFVGRDRGEEVRDKSGIDKIDDSSELVIHIPEDVYSINSSFLEEFLRHKVQSLGKDNFYLKVHFEGGYDIEEDLNEAVYNILRSSNALRK